MSDLIDRQMLKADLLCGDDTEHDYCFPCKKILERIDNQPAAQQKKKNRNGRDSYGRLLVNGWHLEVSSAEINVDNDNIPIVLSVDIYGCDYHGSCFNQTIRPYAQPEQRYTEEELRVFAHGISLSLLSKRSAQHWQYDEDTATEIKFLERLYDKVVADMGDEQDE